MTSRRHFMSTCTGASALLLAATTTARAAGAPLSKASVGYRDIPYNGQVCAQCVYFIFEPTQNNVPQSRCKMVAGPISPAGWCEIFAPKS